MADTHFSGMVLSGDAPLEGNLIGAGNVYYVNGAGSTVGRSQTPSDSNPGTKEQPFATITYALAQCADDKGDVIYVLDYYQPSGETWPISVNKSLVSILGYPSPIGGMFGGFQAWNVAVASGNYPVFDVVANNVLISGFQLYAGTASYAAITMDDGASVVRIDRCRFCRGTYGVHLTAADTGYGIQITNCYFQQGLASGGILIDDDPAFCHIANNYFDRIAGVAISVVSGSGHVIENNHIALGANTNGYAITLGTGVNRAWVNGNHCGYGIENGTTTPYLDDGTVNENSWGTNYFGSAVDDPG